MKLKKKQQQFLIDAHKEVCQEWKTKLENNFPKLFPKPQFEVNRWYKWGGAMPTIGFISSRGYGVDCYAFDYTIKGSDESYDSLHISNLKPATDKEVEEALIKEAKRRGFVEGAKYIGFNGDGDELYDGALVRDGYKYWKYHNLLSCGLGYIFHNGKWAELIKTITKEEAEKKLGKKIVC